jgi:hypothetical protein
VIGFFKTATGNPYSSYVEDITTYIQVSDPNYSTGSRPIDYQTLGLKIPRDSGFCTIPVNWIYKSVPGCSYIEDLNIKDPIENDALNISKCMINNPCNVGVLAFVISDNPTDDSTSKDASSFKITDIAKTPVACVRGEKCTEEGDVAIYDKKYGRAICRKPLPIESSCSPD